MLRTGVFAVGRVAGIPLKIHFSWFLVFFLVTSMLAVEWYPARLPGNSTAFYVALSIGSALLLFGSVFLHELSHALVARIYGVPVRGIVLFVFGGIAEMVGEPRRAFEEVAVAAAGPIASLAIAGGTGALALVLPVGVPRAVLEQLALVNVGLFAFNLIPAFPLDGGRIARALLWGLFGHYQRATFVATVVGIMIAGGLGALGLWLLIGTGALGGLWLALISLFVGRAALQAYRRARLTDALRVSLVSEVMVPSAPYLGPAMTLAEADERQPGCLDRGVAVGEAERAVGWVEVARIAEIPETQWRNIRLGDVMTRADRLAVLAPSDPLELLFRIFAMERSPAALIVQDGRWVGTAGRGALVAYFQRLQRAEA